MFGVFFFVSLYMQNVLGYSAVQAGAAFLPMTLLIILVAPIAGKTSDRFGSRWLMTIGMVLLGVQLLYFSQLSATASFWNLLPGFILGGFGMAMAMTPTAAAATRAVPGKVESGLGVPAPLQRVERPDDTGRAGIEGRLGAAGRDRSVGWSRPEALPPVCVVHVGDDPRDRGAYAALFPALVCDRLEVLGPEEHQASRRSRIAFRSSARIRSTRRSSSSSGSCSAWM